MQRYILAGIAAAVLCAGEFALAKAISNDGKLTGEYQIYSGDLGDSGPPTANDAKVNLSITGAAARAMYTQMGRRAETRGCAVVRQRGDLICENNNGEFVCGIGINLKTGKTTVGMIC